MSQEGRRQIFLFDISPQVLYNEMRITKKGSDTTCPKEKITDLGKDSRTSKDDLLKDRRQDGIQPLQVAALSHQGQDGAAPRQRRGKLVQKMSKEQRTNIRDSDFSVLC